MTVIFKKTINVFLLVILSSCLAWNFSFAQVKETKPTSSFSSFTEAIKEAAKSLVGGKDTPAPAEAPMAKTMMAAPMSADVSNTEMATDTEEEEKTTCEYFDSTVVGVLSLSAASAETRQKIENVEATINDESFLRESLLGTVKDLVGLQKKDKVIFREMKKDIADAKNYYNDVDKKVEDTEKYLDENSCEEVKIEIAKGVDEDIENAVLDEETYRKQFAASLKEKMKILQDGVKSAKK